MVNTLARRSSLPPMRARTSPTRPPRAPALTEEVAYGQPSGLFLWNQLERLYGSVDDLDVKLGWKTKKEMMHDPYASGAIHTLVLGATAREGEVVSTDSNRFESEPGTPERKAEEKMAEETAGLCRRSVAGMQKSFLLMLFQLGVSALVIGHAKAEIVLKLQTTGADTGKYVLDRIKSKPRETTGFIVDRQMNVQGIAAFTGNASQFQNFDTKRAAPNAQLFSWQTLGMSGWTVLDREKFLVITHKPTDDDSPLGTSALRPAFAYWRMKRDFAAYYNHALDNASMPAWVAEIPQALGDMYPLDEYGMQDKAKAKVPAGTVIQSALLFARKGAGVATVPTGVKVNALHQSQSGDPFAAGMAFCNGEITQGVLGQQLATNESQHMARAAGQVHQDVLDTYIKYVRRMLSEAVTRDVFGLLVRKNFPERYWHLIPSYSLGEVELNDFAAWAVAIARLNEAGLLDWSQYPAIWKLLGLPQAELDLVRARQEKEAGLLDAMTQPQVDPATGQPGASQIQEYRQQETGKRLTRQIGRKDAAHAAIAFSENKQAALVGFSAGYDAAFAQFAGVEI
jgi:hypothetical protein